MIIKKEKKNYYVCRRHGTYTDEYNGIYLIKPDNYSGRVILNVVSFPLNWIGKRVKFKIEVLKNDKPR